jgi:hypothetical protein
LFHEQQQKGAIITNARPSKNHVYNKVPARTCPFQRISARSRQLQPFWPTFSHFLPEMNKSGWEFEFLQDATSTTIQYLMLLMFVAFVLFVQVPAIIRQKVPEFARLGQKARENARNRQIPPEAARVALAQPEPSTLNNLHSRTIAKRWRAYL